jgi:hypothetical protein
VSGPGRAGETDAVNCVRQIESARELQLRQVFPWRSQPHVAEWTTF